MFTYYIYNNIYIYIYIQCTPFCIHKSHSSNHSQCNNNRLPFFVMTLSTIWPSDPPCTAASFRSQTSPLR